MQADISKDIAAAWEILQSIKIRNAKGIRAEKGKEIIGISRKKMV